MLNAACDADYAKYAKKDAAGTWTISVDKESCTRLQKECYDFINEREKMG